MTAIALSSSSAPPLNKYLASTEKKTRDKAIKTLSVFLSDESRDEVPQSEMIRLWKGIFYCFWMSDKPLVQQALASELAELILTTTNMSSALSFLNGFWKTIVREWNGIDRLRLDKYLMLVRRFVNVSLRFLMQHGWDSKICQEYNNILTHQGGPLCPSDGRVSVGLVYHVTDVYLEELDKSHRSSTQDAPKPVPLALILSPFFNLAAQTPLGTTYKHLQTSLFEPLLSSCSLQEASSEEEEDKDELRARKRRRVESSSSDIYASIISNACLDDASAEAKLPSNALRRRILRRLFEVASHAETRDANRRKIYALCNAEHDDDDLSEE
ncbi:nucleolar protein,Nop52-domain-containing protein [Lentinula aciculospora]|uniref:Nucleolar protein,Nop52-domain-containing protein n=1 Tax=Lentinula aciculospora TaxID=153920 RepID=A0A9W9ANE9_9AGAR|nr:nucleolar protein,Nop52-domain-containing protein [Lentinula aciculospora]